MWEAGERVIGSKQEFIKRMLIILFSNTITALAINCFYGHNHFLSGGVGGMAIIIWHLTKIPVGVWMFILNIPLAYLGWRYLNAKFSFYAIISAFVLSFLVFITRGLSQRNYLDDILLSALFGGTLNGFAMGVLFRNDLCQGGIDFLARIAKDRYNLNVGTALMGMNIVIISLGALLFGINRALYTVICMRVSYIMLDRVQMGLDMRKQMIIITGKSDEVARRIMDELKRGVTYLHGSGGYMGRTKRFFTASLRMRKSSR